MLSTIISWTSVLDLARQVRLDVGRVRGGVIADYKAVLVDEAVGEELATADIMEYPRWSEPVAGLIARALHRCTSSGGPIQLRTVQPVRTLQLKIGLLPGGRGSRRELLQLTGDFRTTRTPVLGCDEERGGLWDTKDLPIGSHDPLGIAVQALSQWLWDTPQPHGWPKPLSVPVRHFGDIAYVRLRDIAEPAQSAFRIRMNGATAPVIDGDPDVAYVSDWEIFLGGRT